jgi:hypothetical protein
VRDAYLATTVLQCDATMTEIRRWFDSIQTDIAQDFADARLAHKEDIQRSGHEGESTWADLFAKWLPPEYGVGLRKYIIGPDESEKPFETDIVIFEPAYPQHLRYRTKIHAAGVAAAFSVKLTARPAHYEEIATWSARLANLGVPDTNTLEGQLLSTFPTGFLAHSHELGRGEAIENLKTGFDGVSAHALHPRELVDLVCIADLGTLVCKRIPHLPVPPAGPLTFTHYMSIYDDKSYGAVAHLLVSLFEILGRTNPSLKKLAAGLSAETLTGEGFGYRTAWDPNAVFSEAFLETKSDLLYDHGNPRFL